MSTSKSERVLVVINHIDSGETDYLYRFIEEAARGTIQATLGDDYAKIVKLYDGDATLAKLRQLSRLRDKRIALSALTS